MSGQMIYLSKVQRSENASIEIQCSVDDCDGIPDTRGMCSKHYRRWLRNGSTDLMRQAREFCLVDGCGRRHEARGFCQSHYKRWQRHNDPMVRLIKGCAHPGCLARVAVGHYCSDHQPGMVTGTPVPYRQAAETTARS